MNNDISKKAEVWLNSNIVDKESKNQIQALLEADDQTELIDSFYKDLEFGTGGLRGVMGVGSNRINKYTLGKATQGLSNYLLKAFPNQEIKVVVGHDSRNNSDFFADVTASVFSANGIKVYFFRQLRPTPEISYAIRNLGCQSGVVITASHNPKKYNGYKAYWDDGGQVTPPHDRNIIEEVNKMESLDEVNFEKNAKLISEIGLVDVKDVLHDVGVDIEENLWQTVGSVVGKDHEDDIDDQYLEYVKNLTLSPEVIGRHKDLKIVFSSIHGTGITLVPEILKRFGFENVHVVKEQAKPDGNFPTVVYPNPEESEAMSIALKQAQEIDADLILATDPDADRVGIGAKNHKGEFQLINGNQTAALLVYYILRMWVEKGKLDGHQFVVKTIVTTDLILDIAKKFDVEAHETLTGFKYIATMIKQLEGQKKFIVGGEESYGYLIGDYVRDKDAVASCAMLAEMTAWAKDNGMGLFDMLADIYIEFGCRMDNLESIESEGKSGAEKIQEKMKSMRALPPERIHGSRVIKVIDYLSSEVTEYQFDEVTYSKKEIKKDLEDFPKSNVLQYYTEDGTKISARPSGTEPKIKFYLSVKGELKKREDYDLVRAKLADKIESITEELELRKIKPG